MDASLNEMTKVISKSRSKDKREHAKVVQQIKLMLVGTSPANVHKNLAKVLRQSLAPVYAAYMLPALQLASAIFHHIYHEKVLTALGKQLLAEKRQWEDVLSSLLSGVLDVLDESETDNSKSVAVKDAIAAALYPTLCDICFSLTAPMQSVDLRCTAYTLLSDSAASHKTNQQKLRDKAVLGGERLGNMVWRSKDYLALESLLTLFARILPSAKESHSAATKRTAYIKSVFLSPQHSEHTCVGRTIVKLLDSVPSNEWEETSRKIVETLAAAYVAFPQPFSVDKVNACDDTKKCDKLYVDDKAFLVNVLIGDDQCEALEVSYRTVRKIEIVSGQAERSVVNVRVDAPPVIGKIPVKSSTTAPLTVYFTLSLADMDRFCCAIRSRGLGKLLKDVPPKLSLARSPALLDFDSQGQLQKELSQSERIENVEKFYHTNQSSDNLSLASPQPGVQEGEPNVAEVLSTASDMLPAVEMVQKQHSSGSRTKEAAFPGRTAHDDDSNPSDNRSCGEAPVTTVKISAHKTEGDAMAACAAALRDDVPGRKPAISLTRTRSQKMREEVFGASDEELSEVSDMTRASPVLRGSRLTYATGKEASPRRRASPPFKTIATVTRTGAIRRILDSDSDEAGGPNPNEAPSIARSTRNKNKRLVPPTPDVSCVSDDSGSKSLEKSFITPPRSQMNSAMAPLTPMKPSVAKSLPLQDPNSLAVDHLDNVASDAGGKILKVPKRLDTAADCATRPNVTDRGNAVPLSVCAITPTNDGETRSTVHSVELHTVPVGDVLTERISNASKPTRIASGLPDTHQTPAKIVPLPMDLELSNHIMKSSSPIPVVKPGRTSVKAKLRKKDQTLAEDENKEAAHVKTSKRKRAAVDVLEPDNENSRPPSKKSRADDSDQRPRSSLRLRRTDSRILRSTNAAAVRVTQRYRAKKDKTSSPVSNVDMIDYDELPSNSAASVVRAQSPPSSARTPQHRKEEKGKRSAGNASTKDTRSATTSVMENEDQSFVPNPAALHSGQLDLVPTSNTSVHGEDLEDEQEITGILLKPSKPSVTVVGKPVVDAMKASAVSFALTSNPFVAASTVESSEVHTGQHKDEVPKGHKSDKIPWLAALKQTAEHQMDEPWIQTGTADISVKPQLRTKRRAGLPEVNKKNSNESEPSIKLRASASAPRVQTIDLTIEDTPVRRKETPLSVSKRLPSLVPEIDFDDTLVDVPQFATSNPFCKSVAAVGAGSTTKCPRSVTFAVNLEERLSSPSPLSRDSEKADKTLTRIQKAEDANEQKRVNLTKLPAQAVPNVKQSKLASSPNARSPAPHKDVGVEDIVEVLEQLQQAILCRITQRFDGVREEVRFGRNTLLSEASEDLLQLRNQSVSHFNGLIDLEAEYAKLGRLLVNEYGQLLQESQDICLGLGGMVKDHDRSSLVQRMPVGLATLPGCLRAGTKH